MFLNNIVSYVFDKYFQIYVLMHLYVVLIILNCTDTKKKIYFDVMNISVFDILCF